ncbi:TPA: hypothetical protein ACGJRA_002426 [Pseudomonas aeruginosa]|jgi:hypothetical protein|uniref:hypothetical protein n=1 Tax=Pseudomonas aeruginosa TaxID=287 RepID=UPI00053E6E9B|nr:hypothetical protein [Pseudomonas aeruginosa]KSR40495.1 hypothetical protein APB40_15130 [Pseudomonas aeruginosa]MCF1244061.1 hypothetical protein [Pseudomonas aeruginosa]MCF1245182.1 hypothetical protein [Pseudomonas aeruginosa]MDI3835074.1 hypothetical protein [Pseudomonas aeruginosa]OFC12823.1 hypothetical protein AN466_23300 [Pseudomonas aeruginosa]
MMKHTPGPWYRDGTTVYALNPHNFNRFSAQIHGAHTPKSELEAVAQLMQAAPELLEALQSCIQQITALCSADDVPDQARAAIAKATA